MSLDEKTEELLTRIRKQCRDRGWFGADEWMDPGFRNPPPFRTTFPDVATKEQLENIEKQLGFPYFGNIRVDVTARSCFGAM
ncbi:hypothetical protein [Ktedonobacter robiniae]|uniref:Uncharacterized protein n=1 Tax=Ktedonobacter robiniae TaxID=2778365 RepID=A0ABQ3USU2_9CHLR|nr:hypothetical protein [Ktedonobacter robiniae]GHO55771.1 hypothetical protein KSB_42460 [Ktedonobacter robiniae]